MTTKTMSARAARLNHMMNTRTNLLNRIINMGLMEFSPHWDYYRAVMVRADEQIAEAVTAFTKG